MSLNNSVPSVCVHCLSLGGILRGIRLVSKVVFTKAVGSSDSSPFYFTSVVLHRDEHLRRFGLNKFSVSQQPSEV